MTERLSDDELRDLIDVELPAYRYPVRSKVESIATELLAAREDVRRIEWMSEHHGSSDPISGCSHSVLVLPGQTLREAINAAMRAESGEGER